MSDIIDPGQEAVEAESVPRHPIHDRKGLGFDPDTHTFRVRAPSAPPFREGVAVRFCVAIA